MKDTLGIAFLLTINNYPGLFQVKLQTLEDQFPCGSIIAIWEPWMKLSVSEHWAFVCVESPSDIMILENTDPLCQTIVWATAPTWPEHPSSMTEWKERGKDYYKRNSFLPAAQAWTHALELDPSNSDLLLNRSMAHLCLGWPSAAHADTLRVLLLSQSTALEKKAEYHAASAKYLMGKYVLALEHFVRLAHAGQNTEEVRNWQARCKSCMEVQAKISASMYLTL